MRLRENVARAIIPPVHVQPWFPPLFLLRPRSFCSRRRVVHNIPAGQETPFQVPSYLNNGLDQGDFSLLTCSSTQIPLRRDPFGHFHLCQIYFGLLSLSLSLEPPAAHSQLTPSFVGQILLSSGTTQVMMIRQQRLPHSQVTGEVAVCSEAAGSPLTGLLDLPLLSSSSSAPAAAAATRCAHNATSPPSDGGDALTCPSPPPPRPLGACTACVRTCAFVCCCGEKLLIKTIGKMLQD